MSCFLLRQGGKLVGKSRIAYRYDARAFAAGLLDLLHLHIEADGLQAKFLRCKGKFFVAFSERSAL